MRNFTLVKQHHNRRFIKQPPPLTWVPFAKTTLSLLSAWDAWTWSWFLLTCRGTAIWQTDPLPTSVHWPLEPGRYPCTVCRFGRHQAGSWTWWLRTYQWCQRAQSDQWRWQQRCRGLGCCKQVGSGWRWTKQVISILLMFVCISVTRNGPQIENGIRETDSGIRLQDYKIICTACTLYLTLINLSFSIYPFYKLIILHIIVNVLDC